MQQLRNRLWWNRWKIRFSENVGLNIGSCRYSFVFTTLLCFRDFTIHCWRFYGHHFTTDCSWNCPTHFEESSRCRCTSTTCTRKDRNSIRSRKWCPRWTAAILPTWSWLRSSPRPKDTWASEWRMPSSSIFQCIRYVVGGVAQWLGRPSLDGRLSQICAWSMVDMWPLCR